MESRSKPWRRSTKKTITVKRALQWRRKVAKEKSFGTPRSSLIGQNCTLLFSDWFKFYDLSNTILVIPDALPSSGWGQSWKYCRHNQSKIYLLNHLFSNHKNEGTHRMAWKKCIASPKHSKMVSKVGWKKKFLKINMRNIFFSYRNFVSVAVNQ